MMPTSFMPHLYQDLPPIGNKFTNKSNDSNSANPGHGNLDLDISTSMIPSFGSKLGLLLPDPAPDVAPNPEKLLPSTTTTQLGVTQASMFTFQTYECKQQFPKFVCRIELQKKQSLTLCLFFLFTDKMVDNSLDMTSTNEPRKKKYAKEAWPGRKPLLSGL